MNILIRDHGISLTSETVVHSDQGVHYTSYWFIQILHDKVLRQSMSRRGNCWDNAPQESFFGHMKDHIKSRLKQCTEFDQVKEIIDNYIDYYNSERYQWHLAKLSPHEFYQLYLTGEYPIKIANPPSPPTAAKLPEELGATRTTLNCVSSIHADGYLPGEGMNTNPSLCSSTETHLLTQTAGLQIEQSTIWAKLKCGF